jgi:serine/threonine protein kinase
MSGGRRVVINEPVIEEKHEAVVSEDSPVLELNNFKFGVRFGGRNSDVRPAINKKTRYVTIMKFCLAGGRDPALLDRLLFLYQLRHPALVPILGFCLPEGRDPGPAVMTPFMVNGSLAEALEKERKHIVGVGFDVTAKSKCVFGIAVAMAFLHKNGICHGNLKPENVLLNVHFEPCLTDYSLPKLHGKSFLKRMKKGTTICSAPEVLRPRSGVDVDWMPEADVFSYGCILYGLFTKNEVLSCDRLCFKIPGKYPNFNAADYTRCVADGVRLPCLKRIPELYWDLISRCWRQDPQARPTFYEIVRELAAHEGQSYLIHGSNVNDVLEYEQRIVVGLDRAQEPAARVAIGT